MATPAMALSKDLVFLILQFCDEENLKKTAHTLEQETGYFFDLKYFEELVLDGNWEEAEKYLSSFTAVEDNKYSTKIYFEIRKQKFLETLDRHEYAVALDILHKDLKVFGQSNKELYLEMTQLLALDDFREHSSLASYVDAISARTKIVNELGIVIEANPLLRGKTKFPQINKSRLRRLINQSLNWQHFQCVHPHPQPHIDTLFTDHKCPGPDSTQDQLGTESLTPPKPMTTSVSTFTSNATSNEPVNESVIYGRVANLVHLSNQASENGENSHDAPELKSVEPLDEVDSPPDICSNCQDSANKLANEFPRTVKRIFDMDSSPATMNFHPVHQTLLLVGTSIGHIELWDVSCPKQLFKITSMVEETKLFSGVLLENFENNPGISVNRILWSPDGSLFGEPAILKAIELGTWSLGFFVPRLQKVLSMTGVAYSKRMIHLYSYQKYGNYYEKQLEIDAHIGSVNDLAFSKPHEKLVAISCGDDKLIKVWDAVTGAKQHTFEGHGAPVYSVCPHVKDNVHFLFSISTNGEIKAWLFDNLGSRVSYVAPGFCCTRMAYSTDGKRLFSCGTNKEGESYLVEWNESEGFIVRKYHGLSKRSSAMVHFDTTISRFLAAGDEHLIKIWDMDSEKISTVIDADGSLPATPYICFNRKGNLLAISADHNQIKILANDQGSELLQTSAFASGESSGCLTESFRKLAVNTIPVPLKVEVAEGNVTIGGTPYIWETQIPKGTAGSTKVETPNISNIVEVSRCQSVLLTSEVKSPMRRLVYTHSGNAILALAENGIHLLWRWVKNDTNLSGEATAKHAPQLWQPKSGLLMINDLPENDMDIVTPCFSLSKNDSYVVSASGNMITLYNALVFKKMRSIMPPPPAATCILFYPPDNNIVAIGKDDSTIVIYNIRTDEVISKLEGHLKRITGLAFSTTSNVLISSGEDTQIMLWDCATWQKKKSTVLHIPIGWLASDVAETIIELDKDQKHFLAVHETQLALYETPTLQRLKQWAIANFCTRISHATFSCDSELVYAVMKDGILLILGASDLTPRYEIDPSAYLPSRMSFYVDPVVVAAHPQKPSQLALGLSNGGVVIIEPLGSEGKWAALPSQHSNL